MRVWDETPDEGTWPEFESDRSEWHVEVGDGYSESQDKPWNRAGNPYRMALDELRRMLVEAGYRAHACMEVRDVPNFSTDDEDTRWCIRITMSW